MTGGVKATVCETSEKPAVFVDKLRTARLEPSDSSGEGGLLSLVLQVQGLENRLAFEEGHGVAISK
jgi:hypothetical protein